MKNNKEVLQLTNLKFIIKGIIIKILLIIMLNIDIYKKIIKKHIQNKDFIKNLKNLKNKTVYMF